METESTENSEQTNINSKPDVSLPDDNAESNQLNIEEHNANIESQSDTEMSESLEDTTTEEDTTMDEPTTDEQHPKGKTLILSALEGEVLPVSQQGVSRMEYLLGEKIAEIANNLDLSSFGVHNKIAQKAFMEGVVLAANDPLAEMRSKFSKVLIPQVNSEAAKIAMGVEVDEKFALAVNDSIVEMRSKFGEALIPKDELFKPMQEANRHFLETASQIVKDSVPFGTIHDRFSQIDFNAIETAQSDAMAILSTNSAFSDIHTQVYDLSEKMGSALLNINPPSLLPSEDFLLSIEEPSQHKPYELPIIDERFFVPEPLPKGGTLQAEFLVTEGSSKQISNVLNDEFGMEYDPFCHLVQHDSPGYWLITAFNGVLIEAKEFVAKMRNRELEDLFSVQLEWENMTSDIGYVQISDRPRIPIRFYSFNDSVKDKVNFLAQKVLAELKKWGFEVEVSIIIEVEDTLLSTATSSTNTDPQTTLFNVVTMKQYYRYYSIETAKEILNVVEQAWNLQQSEGGRWGPNKFKGLVNATVTTIGRYINAFKKAGVTHWEGVELP